MNQGSFTLLRAHLGRTTGPRLDEPQQPRMSTRRRPILAASTSSYALRLTEPRSAALVVRSRCAPLLLLGIGLLPVCGQTHNGKFQNPLNSGPDPYCEFFGGNYYLTTTQGDAIRMWKSPTLGGLRTAIPVTIWTDTEPSRCRSIWAPEFHFITNRWYVYYTATTADGKDANHRLFVLESEGRDPLGPYHYKGRLFNPTNDQYAIDTTVFRDPGDGRWYCVWAAAPGHVLTIARLASPWAIEGNCAVIPASGFGCAEVREGPQLLQRNGKLFLVYSACDTGKPDYKLGMLIAETNSDLMNPQSWKQYPKPVFERSDRNGVFGPGHNGFFRSPDGTEDWIVYHAKTNSFYTYRGRETRAQKFTWNSDGTPNFGEPLPLSAVLDEPSARAGKSLPD